MFDFGIGGSELLVVAVIAIIVIGPKDLPKVLRAVGKTLAGLRGMASEFQGQLDSAMKDTGLDEIKREVSGLKSMATAEMSKQSENFLKAQQEVAQLLEDEKTTAALAAPALTDVPAVSQTPVILPPQPAVEAPAPEAPVKKAKKAKKAAAKKIAAKKIAKKPVKTASAKAKTSKKAAG